MANRFGNGGFILDLSTSTAVAGACVAANPEGAAILIYGALYDIATASTVAGTLNLNVSSASGSSGTVAALFDAANSTVAGVFSNYSSGQAGTSGVPAAVCTSGQFIVGTWGTAGPSSSFNGNVVLFYVPRST